MKNSENQPHNDYVLRKNQILRGYNSYSKVLQNSVLLSTEYLKAFVNSENNDRVSIDVTNSPHFTDNVKVGFIIAKKKIKKAVERNRIKRLLKESYRLNKNLLKSVPREVNIIFSLTENGYKHFLNDKNTKVFFVEIEMKHLLIKINGNI